MISVKGLRKAFGETVAVDGVSFEVARGEVVGFLGPNGAGKTTTLRMLAGCLPPSSGTAEVAGLSVAGRNLEVRRRVGYLAENNPLYEDMDVSEYLEWTARARGLRGAERTARVRFAVEACGLGDALGRTIGLLSKGFRQRTGLAASILHDPDILLLDEPTSGLDPNQAREVRDLIGRLKQAKTVLLSTHILPEVEASCDRVVIIHKGAIAASGTLQELSGAASGRCMTRFSIRAEGVDPSGARASIREALGAEVARWSEESGELRFEIASGRDAREEVFRLAVRSGWSLLELRREEASLESVFRELTVQ
jgi:ABC-2 type transport system ATP-binding protein